MKQLYNSIEVLNIKEVGGKTLLTLSTDCSKEEIERYRTRGQIKGEIRLQDNHTITNNQRAKIFAIIKDFSLYTGYEAEYSRDLFTLAFCIENNIEHFSLADCSLEVARTFITYLLEFCIDEDIPLSKTPLNQTEDIDRHLYYSIKKSICAVCGKPSLVYSVGDKKISLCNLHYDEAKMKGLQRFQEIYHIYPIKIQKGYI